MSCYNITILSPKKKKFVYNTFMSSSLSLVKMDPYLVLPVNIFVYLLLSSSHSSTERFDSLVRYTLYNYPVLYRVWRVLNHTDLLYIFITVLHPHSSIKPPSNTSRNTRNDSSNLWGKTFITPQKLPNFHFFVLPI